MFFTFMDFSKWEPEDDEKLLEAVKICGIGPWETGILQYSFIRNNHYFLIFTKVEAEMRI